MPYSEAVHLVNFSLVIFYTSSNSKNLNNSTTRAAPGLDHQCSGSHHAAKETRILRRALKGHGYTCPLSFVWVRMVLSPQILASVSSTIGERE